MQYQCEDELGLSFGRRRNFIAYISAVLVSWEAVKRLEGKTFHQVYKIKIIIIKIL